MDIKPLTAPSILPTSGGGARERIAEPFTAPDARADHDATPRLPSVPTEDPGAARIAADPWGSTPTGERLLIANGNGSSPPPVLTDLSLPDAVRSAVDFVFDRGL